MNMDKEDKSKENLVFNENELKLEKLINEYNDPNTLFKILSKDGNWEKTKWDFFHPFFSIMIDKYNLCRMEDTYFNLIDKSLISKVFFKSRNLKEVDLMTVIYNYIDEINGLFVYSMDKDLFFTISIECEESKICPLSELMSNQQEELCFVSILSLSELTAHGRKILIKYKMFLVNNENLIDKPIFSGTTRFQKPKKQLRMAKF
jgi:hypothetical protein